MEIHYIWSFFFVVTTAYRTVVVVVVVEVVVQQKRTNDEESVFIVKSGHYIRGCCYFASHYTFRHSLRLFLFFLFNSLFFISAEYTNCSCLKVVNLLYYLFVWLVDSHVVAAKLQASALFAENFSLLTILLLLLYRSIDQCKLGL